MRLRVFLTLSLAYLGGARAVVQTVIPCSTVTSTVVSSPSASCTVTACAACDNGNYVASQISADYSSFSNVYSSITSLAARSPVPTGAIIPQGVTYSQKILGLPVTSSQLTCFSSGDVTALLNHLGNLLDQVDQLLQLGNSLLRAAVGASTYDQLATGWFMALRTRVQSYYFYVWLSQGCVDWSLVNSINNKINALNANYPSLATGTTGYYIPNIKSPCRDIISYGSLARPCPSSACRVTPVSSSVCASCMVAATAISTFQSNIAIASSSLSAAVSYATNRPFIQSGLNTFMYGKITYESSANVIGGTACMGVNQLRSYLIPLTSYIKSLDNALQNYAILEYPVGGPGVFSRSLGMFSSLKIITWTTMLQAHLNNPTTCYDCDDILAYNAAVTNYFARFIQYSTFSGLNDDIGAAPQLVVDCTTACSSSSVSSIMSSTFASSLDISSSASLSSDIYDAQSSAESTVVSSDSSISALSASDSMSVRSTAPSSDLSVSGSSEEASSTHLSVTTLESSISDISSLSAISLTASSDSASSSLSTVEPSVTSLSSESISLSYVPDGSSSESVVSSTLVATVPPTFTPSAVSSLLPASFTPTLDVSSSFGYLNVSSSSLESAEASESSSTVNPQTTSGVCETCNGVISSPTTLLDTTSNGEVPAGTYTTTEIVTKPCPQCPGGIIVSTTAHLTTAFSTSYRDAVSTAPYGTVLIPHQITESIFSNAGQTTRQGIQQPASTESLFTPSVQVTAVTTSLSATAGTTGAVGVAGLSGSVTSASQTTGAVGVAGLSGSVTSASQTTILQANFGSKQTWSLLAFILAPAWLIL